MTSVTDATLVKYIVSAKQKEDVYEKADNHGRRKTEDKRDGLHTQKIGYIWDYYKLWIIGAVVLVGLVVYFTVVFATREDKPILDVVLVNNYDDVSEDCRLTQGFVSYVGEENLPGRVTFDNNAFLIWQITQIIRTVTI